MAFGYQEGQGWPLAVVWTPAKAAVVKLCLPQGTMGFGLVSSEAGF